MSSDAQNCALCGSLANLMCQRCFESYCSPGCQITDWAHHKLMCIPIPPLIPKQSIKILTGKPIINQFAAGTREYNHMNVENKNKNENVIQMSDIQNRQIHDNNDNMRRPKLSANERFDQNCMGNNSNAAVSVPDNILSQIDNMDIKFTENNNIPSNHHNDRFRNRNNINNIQKNTDNNKFNVNDRLNKCREISTKNEPHNRSQLMENPGFKKNYGIINNNNTTDHIPKKPIIPEIPIIKKVNSHNDNVVNKSMENNNEHSTKPWKIPFPFPNDKSNFKAIVQFVDPIAKLIWLTELSLESHAVKLLKQINTNIQHGIKATANDIVIGNLLAAPFTDSFYYRAIVLENKNINNEVQVRLIDYGNDFKINIDELKLPTPIMKNLNAYAFCCRYNEPSEIGKIINIRVIGKESEEIFIIEEIQDTVLQLEKGNILKLIPNSFNILIMNIFNDKSKAFTVVLDRNTKMELDKLNDILISEETFQYDITTAPKNGDLIAGRKKEWKRGIIIDQCNNKYLIYFIDFGEIEIIEQIKLLPKSFLKIPPQSVLLDINQISIDTQSFNNQYFNNLKILKLIKTGKLTSELSIDCDLYDDKNIKLAEITLSYFNGDVRKIPYLNTWNIPLLTDDIVHITHVIDYCNIYISLSSVHELYSNIFKEIANLKTNNTKKNIEINDIVLIDTYERCCILKKINTNEFHVKNIDTGYKFNMNSNRIIISNDFIKFIPVYTIKCSLDIINILNNPTNPINNGAVQKLKDYCKNHQEFVLRINNKNIIELYFNDTIRNSMNKELIPLLYEMNNNNNNDNLQENKKSFYQINDIEIIRITTGENIKVLILDNSMLKFGTVTGSKCDLTFLDKYYSEYQPKINSICSSNTTEYSPQVNELCFTIYEEDGQWYRALCLKTMPDDIFELKFVDFGNIEITKKSNIRKFDKDFLFPCMANVCSINDLPPTLTDVQLNKLTPILHANGAITVDKIDFVNGTYRIQIDGIKELVEIN